MEKIQKVTFNKGKTTVWFFIDNIRCYDENKNIIEKNEFVCYYKFSEPTIICLGVLVRNNNNVVVTKNPQIALDNAINHVKAHFNFED